jgi:hypothetical protein
VVREVTHEKDDGGAESGNHAVSVRDDVPAFDENKTEREQDRAQTVQGGVDGGQIVNCHNVSGEFTSRLLLFKLGHRF